MRFLLAFILTALLGVALGILLPWWSIAIAAFAVAMAVPLRAGYSFLAGFLGIFTGWATIAIIRNISNEGILSHKIALLFPLEGSSSALILVTAFVGGLVAGFAALAGAYLLKLRVSRNE